MSDKIPQTPTWRKENVRISCDLSPGEMIWRSRQKMLERHGYLLRPRFRPEWVPSWLNTGKNSLLFEDSLCNPVLVLIDATRILDGTKVVIKAVQQGSSETQIATFLSSGDLENDPRNHCIPVLDVVRDESEPTLEFIIMPLLRPFNKPPFFTIEEMLDFVGQALKGLSFMHSIGVAHRDCSDKNILFDAAGMYPNGFHASVWNLDAAGVPTYPLRRSNVSSVRYYFTDFGLSTRFEEGQPRLVMGMDGLDQEVPELSPFSRYNPFPVDVFVLGNVFKRNFLTIYSNTKFLVPLVENMTRRDPIERPSAAEALAKFEELASTVPGYARKWRLKVIGRGKLAAFFFEDVGSVTRACLHILKSLFGSACSKQR